MSAAADDSAQEVEALTPVTAAASSPRPSSPQPLAEMPSPSLPHLKLSVSSPDGEPPSLRTGPDATPKPSSPAQPQASLPSPPVALVEPTSPLVEAPSSSGNEHPAASALANTSIESTATLSPPGPPDEREIPRRKRGLSTSDPSIEAAAFVHWLQSLPPEAAAVASPNSMAQSPIAPSSSADDVVRAPSLELCGTVTSLPELADGTVLAALLSFVDQDYFSHPHAGPPSPSRASDRDSSMEEVLRRQAALKRIHKQALAYLETEEHLSPVHDGAGRLPEALVVDTELLAHSSSTSLTAAAIESELLKLARLVLLVAVHSKHQGMFISAIQSRLDPHDQQGLMHAISSVQSHFALRARTSVDRDHDAATEPETDTESVTDATTTDAEEDDLVLDSPAGAGLSRPILGADVLRANTEHNIDTLDPASASPTRGENGLRSPLRSPLRLNRSPLLRSAASELPIPRSDDESGTLVGSQGGLASGGLTPLQRVPSNSTTAGGGATGPGTTAGSDVEPGLDSDDLLQATSVGFGLFGAGSETLEARGAAVAERLVRKGGTPALVKAFARLRLLYETQTSHTESLEASLSALQERAEAQEVELAALRAGAGAHASETETIQAQRQDIERLTDELRRTEDALAVAEASLDNLRPMAAAGEKLPPQLAEKDAKITALVDRLDEARHASDALTRAQGQIEKYQRKLTELQDVKRQLKSLETENNVLLQRNEAMADEAERAGPVRGLVDRYKAQVKQLQLELTQASSRLHDLQGQYDGLQARLLTANERIKADHEEVELYQERVRELELGAGGRAHVRRASSLSGAEATVDHTDLSFVSEGNPAENGAGGLGEELEDALAPKSRTELRLEVRRLTRERDAAVANKADASRILVLENLLDDANGLKDKYEKDYLTEHQERLFLQRHLEDIASGKSGKGDSVEANLALRTRLNQVIEELDETKKKLVALQVEFDEQAKELTVAKSDRTSPPSGLLVL